MKRLYLLVLIIIMSSIDSLYAQKRPSRYNRYKRTSTSYARRSTDPLVLKKNKEMKKIRDSVATRVEQKEGLIVKLNRKRDSIMATRNGVDAKRGAVEGELSAILKDINKMKSLIHNIKNKKYDTSVKQIQELERILKVFEGKMQLGKIGDSDKEIYMSNRIRLNKKKETFKEIRINFEESIDSLITLENLYCERENEFLNTNFNREKIDAQKKLSEIEESIAEVKNEINEIKSGQLELLSSINNKYKMIGRVKKIMEFKSAKSYAELGESFYKEYEKLEKQKEKKMEPLKNLMQDKTTFEKVSDYKSRLERGKKLIKDVESEYANKNKSLFKKYRELEDKKIIIPMVRDSYIRDSIKDISVDDYDADNEMFTIRYSCCKIDTVIKYKVNAHPKEARLFFQKPKRIKGAMSSQLEKDVKKRVLFNGEIYHKDIPGRIFIVGKRMQPLYRN